MKKLIIIGCVALVFIILIIVVVFMMKNKNTSTTDSSYKPYSSASFNVSYPAGWMASKTNIQGGGDAFTTRVNSTDTFFPRFEVQATPINGQSMEDKIKNLAFYNLTRSETTFKGHQATKLAGNLNLHFDTGNPQQKPVYKVFLFVPTSTTLYTISYAYFDDNTRTAVEKQMQQMLDSLQIQ